MIMKNHSKSNNIYMQDINLLNTKIKFPESWIKQEKSKIIIPVFVNEAENTNKGGMGHSCNAPNVGCNFILIESSNGDLIRQEL